MARTLVLWLLGLVAVCAVHGIFMDRLASKKLCADDDCVYAISLARAQEDYNAPDCRFINISKGQQIYVYSKLVRENAAGEFWAGSVYSDSQDEMGIVGYFPSNLVKEQHVYQEATKEVPTTVSTSEGTREGLKGLCRNCTVQLPRCAEQSPQLPASAVFRDTEFGKASVTTIRVESL
nr:otoraplin [Oryctolagus cuniculus]